MSQYTLTFSRDNNDGDACIDYAWIASGSRSQLTLKHGEHRKTKTDDIKEDQLIVNVFALTNRNVGLDKAWQSGNRSTRITSAEFNVKSSEIVRTIHYADGSSQQDTTPVKPTPLPCGPHRK